MQSFYYLFYAIMLEIGVYYITHDLVAVLTLALILSISEA
jgi:hypothetical protein